MFLQCRHRQAGPGRVRDQTVGRRHKVSCEPSVYLFVLTHEEAKHFLIGALERGVVEPKDIGWHNDEHRAQKDDHNALWRAMRGIKIERHKLEGVWHPVGQPPQLGERMWVESHDVPIDKWRTLRGISQSIFFTGEAFLTVPF
jgi:hypothetical protein